jgi:hypothetical protein
MPQNTITTQPPAPQVIVKKVVKIKKKRSVIGFLSSVIFVLCIFIVVGTILSFSLWIHTYKVFTEERVVAELSVSKKYIKDGKPTFTIKYTPLDDISGFWGIFGADKRSSDNVVVEKEFIGDRFFVESDYISWKNWVTFLNVKPVYKISRITPGFINVEDYKKYNVDPANINGGPDSFFLKLESSQEKFNFFVSSVFISTAGADVMNEDVTYQIKVSPKALIISRK